MAFVVEDGTGLTDSNAYIDVAFADDYFSDRGNTAWSALTTTQKEQAIVLATDYLDYRFEFIGVKSSSEQALEWPRSYAYDQLGNAIDGIPTDLKKACAEYAVRASSSSLAPDPEYDDSGRVVTMKREKVDVIEEEFEYSDNNTSVSTVRAYPSADKLLKDLIVSTDQLMRV